MHNLLPYKVIQFLHKTTVFLIDVNVFIFMEKIYVQDLLIGFSYRKEGREGSILNVCESSRFLATYVWIYIQKTFENK